MEEVEEVEEVEEEEEEEEEVLVLYNCFNDYCFWSNNLVFCNEKLFKKWSGN